ncbi:MAG TPA: dihydrolipoamide acetyltransferase family protein, partial [Thermoanaerobaculia bacterium]|nr:dihydrolipoamide acetyltransferase family protein [Thermoanaerobaculia bacterium]
MATEVVMPQMGESIAEGTITKWLVKVGDRVERDQPLFEISTDKVDAEIPSPAAGQLLEIKHGEGETVAVDALVALIGDPGEAGGEAAEAKAAPEEDRAAPEKDRAAPEEDRAASQPEPEAGGENEPEAAAAEGEAPDAPRGEEAAAPEEPEAEVEAPPSEEERVRLFSSPVVRKIAAKEGVELSQVEGTGAQGRVTKKDILAYIEQREKRPAAKEPAAAVKAPAPRPPSGAGGLPPGASPIPDFTVAAYAEGEAVEIEPMSQIRKITAAHMIYSKHVSAHVTTAFEMDLSNAVRIRERAKRKFAEANGTKLTYMPFIFKATVDALKSHRKLNAAIDGANVVYKKAVNLGMAVALERGLIVPVIRNADRLSLVGLAQAANDLADRARSKKLGPDELQGGTFTITNPGGFGTLFGTPVINQPQVAILGIGAFVKRPVVVTDTAGNDSIAIR